MTFITFCFYSFILLWHVSGIDFKKTWHSIAFLSHIIYRAPFAGAAPHQRPSSTLLEFQSMGSLSLEDFSILKPQNHKTTWPNGERMDQMKWGGLKEKLRESTAATMDCKRWDKRTEGRGVIGLRGGGRRRREEERRERGAGEGDY